MLSKNDLRALLKQHIFKISKQHVLQILKEQNRTLSKQHIFIVGKKWDPGILDSGPFSGQIRKLEARLGKLAKIRKVETD